MKMLPEGMRGITLQIMERTQTPLILFGHTHVRDTDCREGQACHQSRLCGNFISKRREGAVSAASREGNGGWEGGAGQPSMMIRTSRGYPGSFIDPACIVTRPIGVWLRRTFCGRGVVPWNGAGKGDGALHTGYRQLQLAGYPGKILGKVIAELRIGKGRKRRQKDGRSKGEVKIFYVPGQSAGGNDSGYPEAERDRPTRRMPMKVDL